MTSKKFVVAALTIFMGIFAYATGQKVTEAGKEEVSYRELLQKSLQNVAGEQVFQCIHIYNEGDEEELGAGYTLFEIDGGYQMIYSSPQMRSAFHVHHWEYTAKQDWIFQKDRLSIYRSEENNPQIEEISSKGLLCGVKLTTWKKGGEGQEKTSYLYWGYVPKETWQEETLFSAEAGEEEKELLFVVFQKTEPFLTEMPMLEG